MKVLGIAVRVNKGKSTASLVVLEGNPGDDETGVHVSDEFQVTGDDSEWAAHVGGVAAAVRGHATSICPDIVVVRRADQAPHGRNSDGPKLRLLIEGGIVAACRDVTPDVRVRTGKDCGKARSTTKEDLDMRAGTLAGTAHREAVAAALSGFS